MIVLKLNGKRFENFANVDINLMLDTVASTFRFDGFFTVNDTILKDLFFPLTYNSADIYFEDPDNDINEKLITGTILNPAYNSQSQIKLTSISGYSKTGVFEDVNIPTNLYPLQFDNLGLDQIAQKFCDEFGLQLFIYDNAIEDASKPFQLTKAQPEQTIKDFLSDIARSRNLTIAHDNLGRLLIYKIEGKIEPKFRINEDDIGVIDISLSPNAQLLHSDITVIKQSSTSDENESISKVINPLVPSNIKRPKVQIMKHGDSIDTQKIAEGMVCSEAKNLPITIEMEGWTFQNKIVRSGFYIELTAPSIFLNTTKLILESVNFKKTPENGKTMTLKAVLPCVYTGILPTKTPFI